MWNILKKLITGIAIGSIITAVLKGNHALTPESVIVAYLWSIGSAFVFKHHITILLKMLNHGLKLGFISFLTFGNGFLGFIPIVACVVYCLLLGWTHGLVMLGFEIVRILCKHPIYKKYDTIHDQ